MIKCANPTLLSVTYMPKDRSGNTHEHFEVVYKDDSGRVYRSDEPPNADIYIVKPEYRTEKYMKPQERIDHMDKVTVPISKIKQTIANAMGDQGRAFYQECINRRDFKLLNRLYAWPYAYGCDFQPEFYYMRSFYEKYPLGNVKLTTAFMDIETDMADCQPDLDHIAGNAHAPVNLITVIMDSTKEAYTFVLKPYEPPRIGYTKEMYEARYKLYERQLRDHNKLMNDLDGFIRDLHESFDSTYGVLDYHIRVYDKEIELIADAFRYINDRKPNYCMIWNMRFDIQYLYYRIKELGYSPKSIMCHPDFPAESRRCYFRQDTFAFQIEKQTDFFYCSSYTQYICQMRLFASIRKSQHKLKSVSLNAIGDYILRDKKVEYPSDANMVRFQYLSWAKFIKYNIKDVLLQLGIERKTHDIMTYHMRSHANLTPPNKIFRETHLLRNVREQHFEKQGYVQSNNVNILKMTQAEIEFYDLKSDDDDDDNEASYKGAIMADPLQNDYVGLMILGKRSCIVYRLCVDMDMSAFYPSIKIASNMDPATLEGKALLMNEEFISGEYVNRSLNTQYVEKDKFGNMRRMDITGEAVNTYTSMNVMVFGYNWLNLPDVTSLCMMVFENIPV